MRHASPDEAAAAIAGFTVANDISMRDWQNRTLQWLQGKTFEHATPDRPVDGHARRSRRHRARPRAHAARSTASCGSRAARRSSCSGPRPIVAYLSDVVTLRPGDLILTGTPGGVGHAMDPPVYLRAGQTVRTAIEGIGELVNECVPE